MCEATTENAVKALDLLEQEHPEARIYLDFENPYQLLVATILAAQCTDEKVNEVTENLFEEYPDVETLAEADLRTLQPMVKSTGFYRRKSNAIRDMARQVVEEHGGEIPDNLEDLAELPGVGRKTANIVLGNAFGRQAIGVDTHVKRVSRRIGLAREKNPDKIEAELREIVPEERWTRATQLLTTHGRRICEAKKPRCEQCPLRELCDYYAAERS